MRGGRRLLLGLLLLLAAIAVFRRWSAGLSDLEALRLQIESAGLFAPVVYIAVYLLFALLFLPAFPLTIAAGVLFGPIWGTIYASAGSTAGAAGAFLTARAIGRAVRGPQKPRFLGGFRDRRAIGGERVEEWLTKRFGRGVLAHIDQEVRHRGWAYVALLRMIPVIPYGALNYALGLTPIPFLHYIAASWAGMLPWTAAYVLLSFSLLGVVGGKAPGWNLAAAGVAVAALLALSLLIGKKTKKKAPGKGLPGPPEISGLL